MRSSLPLRCYAIVIISSLPLRCRAVRQVRFKNELERNITIKLGYANAKIYKCKDERCPRPACYRAYGSSKEDSPKCEVPGASGLRHTAAALLLLRRRRRPAAAAPCGGPAAAAPALRPCCFPLAAGRGCWILLGGGCSRGAAGCGARERSADRASSWAAVETGQRWGS